MKFETSETKPSCLKCSTRQRNLDESIIHEQLNKLLLSRKAHIGTLWKWINKITSLLTNLNSKKALETQNYKLDYTINEIQKITLKYCSMQTDEIKINRVREISAEQEFCVIRIWKSIDQFLIECFPEPDLVLIQNTQKTIKNQN